MTAIALLRQVTQILSTPMAEVIHLVVTFLAIQNLDHHNGDSCSDAGSSHSLGKVDVIVENF